MAANIWFAGVSNDDNMSDVFDILDLFAAKRRHDEPIAWRDGARLSYGAWLARVQCWMRLLQTMPGARMALFAQDSMEFAAALFGAWHAGKTVYLPADTLPTTCQALRAEVDAFLGDFPAEYAPLLPVGESVVCGDMFLPRLDPNFVGLVVYTSGSTGTAQAIPKKLSQLATEVQTLEAAFGGMAACADVVATVSHQHIYGLLFKLLWPLAARRPLHTHSLIFPEELAALTTQRDCVLVSSPAHLKRLPDSPAWVVAPHRIRAVFSSGGPLSADVAQATADLLGAAPVEVYGSSETGGIAWRQRTLDSDEGWTALPGVAWRRDDAEGVLEVHSLHLPDATWFRTSDRVQALDDRHFLLGGRTDRIVKIEEKRISLDAIETLLTTSPLVQTARVIVLDGKRQRIAAFIVLSDDGKNTLASIGKPALNTQLRAWLAVGIERVALPRSWHYLETLPLNAQGKTTQAELLALLANEQANVPDLPHRKLLEQEAQRVLFELVATQELIYFDGHFDEASILPGVAQVEWAIAFGRECFDLPANFLGMQALKFQRVILPDMPFFLELTHDIAKSSLNFRYFSVTEQHASGKFFFGAGDV